jgi:hypothetical protein
MIDIITYHNNTNTSSVIPQTVMIDIITYHNNTNNSSVIPQTVMIDIITYHNNTHHSSIKPQTMTMTETDRNLGPELGQAQQCGWVKLDKWTPT